MDYIPLLIFVGAVSILVLAILLMRTVLALHFAEVAEDLHVQFSDVRADAEPLEGIVRSLPGLCNIAFASNPLQVKVRHVLSAPRPNGTFNVLNTTIRRRSIGTQNGKQFEFRLIAVYSQTRSTLPSLELSPAISIFGFGAGGEFPVDGLRDYSCSTEEQARAFSLVATPGLKQALRDSGFYLEVIGNDVVMYTCQIGWLRLWSVRNFWLATNAIADELDAALAVPA